MLKTLQNAFKVKDVRHRIFYVLMMLVVIRIGSQLPVPGVDGSYFKTWFESQTGDAFNFLDAFTGGSFSQMSIFALSITPYITSSIIIQLLTIADSKTGRNAERRRRWQKETWCNYPLCNHRIIPV